MKLKRIAAAIMSAAMAISMGGVLSAYAEEAHSGSTTVTATVGSSYSIIVPQAITLENEAGGNGSGTYTNTFNVTVKGDIGENQMVKVTATPPTMTCAGAADVAATFEDGYKTEWSRAEATGTGTAAAYTVKAVDLTPGSWTGTATFNCELGFLISFMIRDTAYQAKEGMTWAEWVASEYNIDGYILQNVGKVDTQPFYDGTTTHWLDIDSKTIVGTSTSNATSGSFVTQISPELRAVEPTDHISSTAAYRTLNYCD